MTLTENQKKGIFATVFFYTGVLILLLIFGLSVPFPPPEEQGILLDFGNSQTGLGLKEPSAGASSEKETRTKSSVPQPVEPQLPEKTKVNSKAENNVLTQDYEKSAEINTGVKKKTEKDKKVISVPQMRDRKRRRKKKG